MLRILRPVNAGVECGLRYQLFQMDGFLIIPSIGYSTDDGDINILVDWLSEPRAEHTQWLYYTTLYFFAIINSLLFFGYWILEQVRNRVWNKSFAGNLEWSSKGRGLTVTG